MKKNKSLHFKKYRLLTLLILCGICTIIRYSRNTMGSPIRISDSFVARSFTLFMNPFRFAIEAVDGKARTEFICQYDSAPPVTKPLTAPFLMNIKGSHNFVVLAYSIWAGGNNVKSYQKNELWLTQSFCHPTAFFYEPPCEGAIKRISLVNRNLYGEINRYETYSCKR